jgi:hypothetical protein
MDQPDIIDLMQRYLDEERGSTLEREIMSAAVAEIRMRRELGDAPVESLIKRNAELSTENRNLRQENSWYRFSMGATRG